MFKEKNIQNQRANTRANTGLKNIAEAVQRAADDYRSARGALLALGIGVGPGTENAHLRQLDDKDIAGPSRQQDPADNMQGARARVGEGHHVPSWIWGGRQASDEDDNYTEGK